jgi:hypothetical protein
MPRVATNQNLIKQNFECLAELSIYSSGIKLKIASFPWTLLKMS